MTSISIFRCLLRIQPETPQLTERLRHTMPLPLTTLRISQQVQIKCTSTNSKRTLSLATNHLQTRWLWHNQRHLSRRTRMRIKVGTQDVVLAHLSSRLERASVRVGPSDSLLSFWPVRSVNITFILLILYEHVKTLASRNCYDILRTFLEIYGTNFKWVQGKWVIIFSLTQWN